MNGMALASKILHAGVLDVHRLLHAFNDQFLGSNRVIPTCFSETILMRHKNNHSNTGGKYLPTEILQQLMGCNAIEYNITLSLFNISGEKNSLLLFW